MAKPNNQEKKSLAQRLEHCANTKRCIDRVQIVSLFHKTGHISLITKKNKVIKTTSDELITELLTDKNPKIVKKGCQLFENELIFKYPEARSKQYDRIFSHAKLTHLSFSVDSIGCFELHVIVNKDLSTIVTNPQIENKEQLKSVMVIPS